MICDWGVIGNLVGMSPWGVPDSGRPGLALVVLSVVEQRLGAVGLCWAAWMSSRLRREQGCIARRCIGGSRGIWPRGSAGWRTGRIVRCRVPGRRRRWSRSRWRRCAGPIRGGDAADPVGAAAPPTWSDETVGVPSERTIDRILIRRGLLRQRPRNGPGVVEAIRNRPGPMQLWGIDIVGGIELVDVATGELRAAKIVTGVDDHSRFCVMAAVVERATARAVCSAFAQALARYGPPEEVITDNGKQFTDRFNRYGASRGEVLFDKICRKNGITHRLTQPASPNQNGKVERFHGTFRPDFLADADPFESVAAAQAAVDGWVAGYRRATPSGPRPRRPVVPPDRFRAAAPVEGEAVAATDPRRSRRSPSR